MIDPVQRLRRALRRSETCIWLLSHVRPLYRLLAVHRDTQIVIEGYPRCANSFAVIAFEMSQPEPVRIAHHLHSVAQLRSGVRLGIPTLSLIREPREAVLSLAIRRELASLRWPVDEYIDFYQGVAELGNAVMVADFREVTSDFGAVIRRLNQRYGVDFAEFQHTEANVTACYEQIDCIERRIAGGHIRTTHVARPSQQRREQKQKLAAELDSPALQPRIAEAERLYASICRAHSIDVAASRMPL